MLDHGVMVAMSFIRARWRSTVSALLVVLAASPAVAGIRRRAVASGRAVPSAAHVFLVMMENTDEAVAEPLPYIQQLASAGALLENYHGVAHPSQPNYIALAAGSAWGIRNDTTVTIDVQNVADLIETRGLTWKVYAENYPGNCFRGDTNGTVAQGQYVRRHNPFIEFADVQNDTARCNAHIVDASELDADVASGSLPNFSFYVPNDQHNGHDSSAQAADAWLRSRFAPLLSDARFTTGMLFIVTYDESGSSGSNNAVSAVFVGEKVRPAAESFAWYDHYSLLHTIEAALGIGTLGQQDTPAPLITGIWK
jgi:acid phosphatase